MSKTLYILDPGHGAINPINGEYQTPGNESPIWPDGSHWQEGVGVRLIANQVSIKLRRLGIDVDFTVKPSNWKDVSRTSRIQKANNLSKSRSCVLISIHTNGSSSESSNGREVFIASNASETSKELAKIWNDKMKIKFPNQKDRGVKVKNWDMVYKTNCPAILIEPAFHTNQKECKLLLNHTSKFVDVIVESIQELEKCKN